MVKKKILLVGGAGYIGHKVTDYLLRMGHSVRCLDLCLYENGSSIVNFLDNPDYSFFYGDMCNEKTFLDSLSDITDVVFLAGLVGDPITKKYPEASNLINDLGVINCINQLNGRGLNQVIFISTCSNYGLIPDGVLADEKYELAPLSLYAKSKVAAETHILGGKGSVDYVPTVLRFATAFGLAPRMRFDLTVNEFSRELALGKDLLVFDADTWRPYCHVNDFARLINMVLSANKDDVGFEVFNAGGDINNYTKQGIIDLILDYVPGVEKNVSYKAQGADPRNYKVNFSKVKDVLGFEPKYTVRDGVVEIVDAIKSHIFDFADVRKNYHGNYEINY